MTKVIEAAAVVTSVELNAVEGNTLRFGLAAIDGALRVEDGFDRVFHFIGGVIHRTERAIVHVAREVLDFGEDVFLASIGLADYGFHLAVHVGHELVQLAKDAGAFVIIEGEIAVIKLEGFVKRVAIGTEIFAIEAFEAVALEIAIDKMILAHALARLEAKTVVAIIALDTALVATTKLVLHRIHEAAEDIRADFRLLVAEGEYAIASLIARGEIVVAEAEAAAERVLAHVLDGVAYRLVGWSAELQAFEVEVQDPTVVELSGLFVDPDSGHALAFKFVAVEA